MDYGIITLELMFNGKNNIEQFKKEMENDGYKMPSVKALQAAANYIFDEYKSNVFDQELVDIVQQIIDANN